MSITMFSVGKTSFEMYFQTITNESGVRSVCYDASIQPYPLVLVLWLYTYTVNLHYNTIVTHLERPENKKCPNFCKTAATQCPKKRCTKGSVHEKKTPQRKGPNAELRNLLCMIVTLGTPFKDIWKVLKRKKFLLGSHPVSEKAVQQICGCRVQNHAGEVTNVRFMTFSLIFVVVRLGSIPGRS